MDGVRQIEDVRKQYVAKRTDFIQQGRKSLSAVENKAVSYAISLIKPGDKLDPNDPQNYKIIIFDCAEFYELMKWKRQSYSDIRAMMIKIASQVFCIVETDEKGNKVEKICNFFSAIRLHEVTKGNKKEIVSDSDLPARYIELKIHEDIAPYLFDLDDQYRVKGYHYTSYQLQNISLMKHVYSQTLYELLKSYDNNRTWTFELGTGSEQDLHLLIASYEPDVSPSARSDEPKLGRHKRSVPSQVKLKPVIPKNWSNYSRFKRSVLDPAVEEINTYTDLKVSYTVSKADLHKIKHRKYSSITFTIKHKTSSETSETERIIDNEYRREADARNFHQMSLDEIVEGFVPAVEVESEQSSITLDDLIDDEGNIYISKYDIAAGTFGEYYSAKEIDYLVEMALEKRDPTASKWEDREMWAIDYISHYNLKIQATSDSTYSTNYKRLLDAISKDYDGFAGQITQYRHVEAISEDDSDIIAPDEMSEADIDAAVAELLAKKDKIRKGRKNG